MVGYDEQGVSLKIDIYGVLVCDLVWELLVYVYVCYGECLMLLECDFNFLLLSELYVEIDCICELQWCSGEV